MGQGVEVKTCNKKYQADCNTEYPQVTFALISYNQERFIADAIAGAFGQTYPSLEIIISDDCSSDDTFRIIKEAVAAYDGPHKVHFMQTAKNVGTLMHVAMVAKRATGGLLVLAAGDDISKPERCSELAEIWKATRAWAISSRFDKIDELGLVQGTSLESAVVNDPNYRLRQYFYEKEGSVSIVHGATSAYDVRLFEYLPVSNNSYILSEDGALSVLLNMLGEKIVNIHKSLVFYRESSQSLTNAGRKNFLSMLEIAENELKIEVMARSQYNRCRFFLELNDFLGQRKVRSLNASLIREDMAQQKARSQWTKLSFDERINFIFNDCNRSSLSWVLPRLFGMRFFYFVKMLRGFFYIRR